MTQDGSAGRFDLAFPAEGLARFDVVVLAGGGARRLGGRDKPGLVIGGRAIIESVVAAGAGAGAARVIVVGPPRDGLDGAVFVREEPAGAGPVPALRRGLAEVLAPSVVLLAADLPFLRAGHVRALLAAAAWPRGSGGTVPPGVNGAVLTDDDGREQWLAGAWRTSVLREALDRYRGESLRGVLGPLGPELLGSELLGLGEPGRGAGAPPPWLDCDTPEDVERARGY
ncbi:MAG TPA: NTP transferase domain-containing protein [Streptosporangiaceae bacterium]|nr:NTP transferase domain-containing protein [Streptosporangiaceae bacterium]